MSKVLARHTATVRDGAAGGMGTSRPFAFERASRRLRIGVAAIGDVRTPAHWSGIPHYMARALTQAGHDVVPIGPLKSPLRAPMQLLARLQRAAGVPSMSPVHTAMVSDQLAADYARHVRRLAPDVVLAPAGSPFAWSTPPGTPLVYTSDATFRRIEGFYTRYSHLSRRASRGAEELERRSIERADLLVYPSEWAAQSAIHDYAADPRRVHVIEWGANFETTAYARDDEAPSDRCNLLLVGVDWARKGVDVAVSALQALRHAGIDARLVVCGCAPPQTVAVEGLTIIPFLDKSDPDQRATLEQLFVDADFLILPSRAECYGIVFCEAAAFGVPALGPAVGGVPTIVRDGVNGHVLPASATGTDYARVISDLLAAPERYRALRRNSTAEFKQRLNWQAWAERTVELMRSL